MLWKNGGEYVRDSGTFMDGLELFSECDFRVFRNNPGQCISHSKQVGGGGVPTEFLLHEGLLIAAEAFGDEIASLPLFAN